jgi:hypothetical protein
VLTHAGDGSNRVFVATQHGVIHVFPNDQKATSTTIFLVPSPIQGERVFLRLLYVESGTADERRLAVSGPQG